MAGRQSEPGLRGSREGHEKLPSNKGIEDKAKRPNSNKKAWPESLELLKELPVEEAKGGAGGGAGTGASGAFIGPGALPPWNGPPSKLANHCNRPVI